MKKKELQFISPGKLLTYLTNSIQTYTTIINNPEKSGAKKEAHETVVALCEALKLKDEDMIKKINQGNFNMNIADFITTLKENEINLADLFVIPDQTKKKPPRNLK